MGYQTPRNMDQICISLSSSRQQLSRPRLKLFAYRINPVTSDINKVITSSGHELALHCFHIHLWRELPGLLRSFCFDLIQCEKNFKHRRFKHLQINLLAKFEILKWNAVIPYIMYLHETLIIASVLLLPFYSERCLQQSLWVTAIEPFTNIAILIPFKNIIKSFILTYWSFGWIQICMNHTYVLSLNSFPYSVL